MTESGVQDSVISASAAVHFHAKHCGWLVFTDHHVVFFGREADRDIVRWRTQGYGIKKIWCSPRRKPDPVYPGLLSRVLHRLLSVSPNDALALEVLKLPGGREDDSALYIDITDITDITASSL